MGEYGHCKPIKIKKKLATRHTVTSADFVSQPPRDAHDSTVLLIVCIKKSYRAKSGAVRPNEHLVAGMGPPNETSVALSEWQSP
jgi:hypothetical protein